MGSQLATLTRLPQRGQFNPLLRFTASLSGSPIGRTSTTKLASRTCSRPRRPSLSPNRKARRPPPRRL